MEIDEKKLAEITAEAAAKAVDGYKAKEITRKVPAGDTEVKVFASPEDKLFKDGMGGFKSVAHFLEELIKDDTARFTGSREVPETLRAWDAAVRTKDLSEGSLSAGGYLVPTQIGAAIIDKALEESVVYPRASIQPMTSNRITFAADVDANHSTNYFGGITIYRPGEAGQKTASSPTYEQIALTLHKVTGLCHISDELLEDSSVAVAADITRKFSQAIAFVQDDDFINGNGVNAPLGFLNSNNPSLITVTAETGQGASTIVAENIIKMWARLFPQGANRCVWIANPDTFPQLATMALAVGTGGVPLWLPANGLAGQPMQTLMGRPLLFSEKCQTLGTAGDISLVDLSQYKIGEKAGGIQIATSIHFKFDYDQQSFRFVLRYDGQPTWTSALTPLRSSSTLSPFVVLSGTRT